MNAVSNDGKELQVNTIYSLHHLYEYRTFKACQSSDVTELFYHSHDQFERQQELHSMLEAEKWPKEMETARKNIIRTSSRY